MLPQAAPEHPVPDTDQLTVFTAFAGVTVTENWIEEPAAICSVAGNTVTCCGSMIGCWVNDCAAGGLPWPHPARATSAMTASMRAKEPAIRSASCRYIG